MHFTFNRIRLISFFCAAVAIATGIVFFQIGGAPVRYSFVNFFAFIFGALLLILIKPNKWSQSVSERLIVLIGLLLLAVAIWGAALYGVHRWLVIAGIYFEPGMMLLPLSVLLFAKNQSISSTVGMALIVLAVTVQPDRSMAGALCLSLLTMQCWKRNKWITITFITSLVGFGITLIRPDNVPPAPFVENVFFKAFQLHPFLGCAVVVSVVFLLFPPVAGLLRWNNEKAVYSAFIGLWLALFIAAAVSNYPTPLLGYGCSGILGYLISVACLSKGSELIEHSDE